jgi:putative FmdB family regulatory protein
MPLYEYKCSNCNYKFEELHRLSESGANATCPVCKGTAKRIMSTFAVMSRDSGGLTSSIGGSSGCDSCGSASSCTSS